MMADHKQLPSKFRLLAMLPVVLMLFFVIVFLLVLPISLADETSVLLIQFGLILFLGFTFVWLLFGEIRTKAIKVYVENDGITVRSYLGFGNKRTYLFSDFDGFVTCMVPNRYETYEYLYLLQGGKKEVKLSEYYHKNYKELKEAISLGLPNLGRIPYRLGEDVKEIFTR